MRRQLTSAVVALGSARDNPDISYVTGLRMPDSVVYLQQGQKKHLVVPLLDRELARRVAPGIKVYSPDALKIPRTGCSPLSQWLMGLLRKLAIRTLTVAADFPVGTADYLRRAGFRLQIADGPLFPARALKTPTEVARIGECQRAAVRAMRAAIRLIARSQPDHRGRLRIRGRLLTSAYLRRVIHQLLMDRNCVGDGTIVACGAHAVMPHNVGQGPLRAHESIIIDIFPRHLAHGYHGDLTRTVVRGTASAELKKMYFAVKAAQAAALAEIRAGVSVGRVHKVAATVLARRGFKSGLLDGKAQGFIHSTGHGIGLAIHEAPALSRGRQRLRAGQVLTVEPGLYYFRHGGVRIEDTVLITRRGYRKLAPCKDVFEV